MVTHRIDIGAAPGHPGKVVMIYKGQSIGEASVPLCEAARYLLQHGHAQPEDRIETYRGPTMCLRAPVGKAAGLTVKDDGVGRPRFKKYVPGVSS